jgi:CBS-domain-containing membrane protein
MQAKDLMQRDVLSVRPESSLAAVAQMLLKAGINNAPVIDGEGRLVGMIGLKDILRAPSRADDGAWITRYTSLEARARAVAGTPVAQVMARRVITTAPDTPATEVAALLVNRGRHPIPVVAEGRVVGVIGRADVVAAILALVPTAHTGAADETAPSAGAGGSCGVA